MNNTHLEALKELLHISHTVGSNPLIVQAGGGNTSVKCGDGTMLIKASGTPLGMMTMEKGWVQVSLKGIKSLYSRKDLTKISTNDREKEVLKVMYASVITPKEARPSVETPLHAILDRVVLHTHPVAVTALGCHPQGEKICAKIFAKEKLPPLWVNYTDPGATLAFTVAGMVDAYKKRHGALPAVIFQANHGLFVSGTSPVDAIIRQAGVLRAIEEYFLLAAPDVMTAASMKAVEKGIRSVLDTKQKKTVIRFSRRPELAAAARSATGQVFRDALTPDHVVYSGPCAAFLPANPSAAAVEKTTRAYIKKWKLAPRLFLVKNGTMVIAHESVSKVDAAEAISVAAAQASAANGNKITFLDKERADFIMNWEAEHYRAKQN